MGALDPSPWAELQVSGAIPATGICPSRLPRSGSTFLLLLALPPPHAPSCSLRSGFPVAANNVLIHSAAGIWWQGEGPGAEEKEGGRQRSERACPGPAAVKGTLWGSLALCSSWFPTGTRAGRSCGLSTCPPVVPSKPAASFSPVYWELESCKRPAGWCTGTWLLLPGERP